MRDLLQQFLDHGISRREFGAGLTALGLSTAAVNSVLAATADEADVLPRDGIKVEGTGADILVETFLRRRCALCFRYDRYRPVAIFRCPCNKR